MKNNKTNRTIGYFISVAGLLISPYVVPILARYFQDVSRHTFRITPWLGFLFITALLLPVLLVSHVYFFHRLELNRKKLIELCLSTIFAIAAPLVFFSVIHIPSIADRFPIVCCFLLAFTLLTALLFDKKTE